MFQFCSQDSPVASGRQEGNSMEPEMELGVPDRSNEYRKQITILRELKLLASVTFGRRLFRSNQRMGLSNGAALASPRKRFGI
jgi:hypothetical protein